MPLHTKLYSVTGRFGTLPLSGVQNRVMSPTTVSWLPAFDLYAPKPPSSTDSVALLSYAKQSASNFISSWPPHCARAAGAMAHSASIATNPATPMLFFMLYLPGAGRGPSGRGTESVVVAYR